MGNCAGCHSAPGGEQFAGGLRLESDYGAFITPNITPDAKTGWRLERRRFLSRPA
jgi:mono/diheme cytochrome c family protein